MQNRDYTEGHSKGLSTARRVHGRRNVKTSLTYLVSMISLNEASCIELGN